MYDSVFDNVPELETLAVRDYATPAHHIYIIALHLERLTTDRDGFLDAIQSAGIGVAVHYVALHLQPYYVKNFNTKPQDFPIASNYSERVISLPLYPKMSSADAERVIATVTDLVKKFKR
jgi:dTDP-4-amino-4,6-dideoxygalactose transaminase